MKILYRVSPGLSMHPNPLGKNKMEIIQKCWASFNPIDKKHNVIIINDGLDKEEAKQIFGSSHKIINTHGIGNIDTFNTQLGFAMELENEEKVFFVEDDYFWVNGAIEEVEKALDTFDLVSPYDHPGHYTENRFKHLPKRMVLAGNRTFREAPSNTLTFACKAFVIKQNIVEIQKWGIRDHELFSSLPVDMWVPVPSLATHLVSGLMAPNVKWL